MLILTLITFFLQFQGLNGQTLDANGITLDEKVLAIERLLLNPGTIIFPVTPCDLVLNGPPVNSPDVSGDQTAAQWVRTVFHDFITANVTAGTGGLDASVSFEADRDENLGIVFQAGTSGTSFINATIIGFNLFSTVFVSTSDFIALGLAASLLSCDPDARMIQLKAGRIDAPGPGPTGVPRPQDSLLTARAAFANAGFSNTEMIQAVACGHSLGAVHNKNFPQIVLDEPTIGSDGADHFDSTPFVFDNVGVNEYLNGSGQAGGPLVTTKNQTFQSDLRIFTSDSPPNTTIKAMAASPQSFEDTCFTIFEKMLNTVPTKPNKVVLSDVIGPRRWILMESHLDLSPAGVVQYSGTITTYSKNAPAPVPSTASYNYSLATGGNTGVNKSQPGVLQNDTVNGAVSIPFGDITFYTFNDTIGTKNVTSINIQNTYTETINLKLFIVPSRSFFNPDGGRPRYVVRAALLSTLVTASTTLNGTLYFPAAQPNSVAPKYTQVSTKMTVQKKVGSYTIFQGVLAQNAGNANGAGISHIDVQLGTTMRTPKAKIVVGDTFFGQCTNGDMTTC